MEYKRLIIKEALELEREYRYREALEETFIFIEKLKAKKEVTEFDGALFQYAVTRVHKYRRILTYVEEIKGFINSKEIKNKEPNEIEKDVLEYYEEKYNPKKEPDNDLPYYLSERIKKYVLGALLELNIEIGNVKS